MFDEISRLLEEAKRYVRDVFAEYMYGWAHILIFEELVNSSFPGCLLRNHWCR
jgi:hypothetical protein